MTSNRTRSHHQGSVFQRKDGRWVASIGESGQKVQKYARTREEARQKLYQMLEQRRQGVKLTSGRVKLSHYLHRWLEDSMKPTVRPRTFDGYKSTVRVRIDPWIGDLQLSKVTPAVLRQLYADLGKTGLSSWSIINTHRLLHRAFQQALHDGFLGRNPCDAVKPPRAEKSEMKTLSQDQANALIAGTVDDRFHALYVLAITGGLRIGELLGLRWSDINLDVKRLEVRRSLQRQGRQGLVLVEPKTKKSRRTVTLADRAVKALRDHRRYQAEERLKAGPEWDDQDLVFPNTIGDRQDPGYISVRFKNHLERIGLPKVRFHDLRHTCATLLLQEGVHAKLVSEMLGHSTIVLTLDTYSHVIPTMHSDAAAAMDRMFV